MSLENRNDFIISAFTTFWGPRCPLSSFLLLRGKSEKKLKYIRKGDSGKPRKKKETKKKKENGSAHASKRRKNARAIPATTGEKPTRWDGVSEAHNRLPSPAQQATSLKQQNADPCPSQ